MRRIEVDEEGFLGIVQRKKNLFFNPSLSA
jgi:hypothetical protein